MNLLIKHAIIVAAVMLGSVGVAHASDVVTLRVETTGETVEAAMLTAEILLKRQCDSLAGAPFGDIVVDTVEGFTIKAHQACRICTHYCDVR